MKQDWKWSYSIDKFGEVQFSDLTSSKIDIVPFLGFEKVFLSLKEVLIPGWYLLGFRHSSDSNKIYGTFKSSPHSFSQSRLMLSNKWRWRIVRVKKFNKPYLKLENICEDINITGLILFRVHSLYAFKRINTRLSKIFGQNFYFNLNKPFLWKKYNYLLSKNAFPRVLKYKDWQNYYEKKVLSKIFTKNYILQNKFFILSNSEITPAPKDTFVIPVAKNDKLPPWANFVIDKSIIKSQKCDLFYGDEDCVNKLGVRSLPKFKPAWNFELFLSDPSFSNSWIVSSKLWNYSLNEIIKRKESLTLHSIILEATIQVMINKMFSSRVIHISFILYHMKIDDLNKKYLRKANIKESKERYIQILKNKKNFGGLEKVSIIKENAGYRYHWSIPKTSFLSILIPTRNSLEILKNCLRSIEQFPAGCDFEIIIIDNGSTDKSTLEFLNRFPEEYNIGQKRIVIKKPGPFNYSKINNEATLFASGDVLLFLNNDTEFKTKNWGKEIISNALRPSIGCVGAKLLFEDKTVQHGGVVLGIGGVAGHAHKFFKKDSFGYQSRLILSQEFSAVTGACLAISTENWNLIGGFDQNHLRINYSDVDLCLKALKKGLRNIYLPHVILTHHESKSRGRPKGRFYSQWKKEANFLKNKWKGLISNDPAYSPHLTMFEENFSLSIRNEKTIRIRSKFDYFEELF